jgi:hypothetical protein
MHDTDCASGQTCACHDSPYKGGLDNACVAGTCRVDSDCGPGDYCSPSTDTNSCGFLVGYFCHTLADECIDDTDCKMPMPVVGIATCAYSSSVGHWQCIAAQLCE